MIEDLLNPAKRIEDEHRDRDRIRRPSGGDRSALNCERLWPVTERGKVDLLECDLGRIQCRSRAYCSPRLNGLRLPKSASVHNPVWSAADRKSSDSVCSRER